MWLDQYFPLIIPTTASRAESVRVNAAYYAGTLEFQIVCFACFGTYSSMRFKCLWAVICNQETIGRLKIDANKMWEGTTELAMEMLAKVEAEMWIGGDLDNSARMRRRAPTMVATLVKIRRGA